MIYFDSVRFVADTMKEMHDFAQERGVPKKYFTNHPHLPHYIHDCGYKGPQFTGMLLRMASKWKKKPVKAKNGKPAVKGIRKVPTAKKVSNAALMTRSHAMLTRP